MKGEREKCLAVGMDHYITKPITKEDLISVLSTWCGHKLVKEAKTQKM
jgi:CheY-like chemotaxis protein